MSQRGWRLLLAIGLAVLTSSSYYVFTLRHRAATPTRPGAFHIDSADAQQWANLMRNYWEGFGF